MASSDAFDSPLIDPGFLTTDFDVLAFREGVKISKRFMTASTWDQFIIGPYGDFKFATDDEAIDSYIRSNARSIRHPVGTAAMSAWDAKNGVVNPDLTVKKVRGLRIVDASIMVRAFISVTNIP